MSDIVLRVRDYPWQWSDEFAHAYTYDEIECDAIMYHGFSDYKVLYNSLEEK